MAVDTTTTHILLSGVVTGLYLLTYMFLVALPLLKLYCMDYFSYRRRSIGERISSTGGPSKSLAVMLGSYGYISVVQ